MAERGHVVDFATNAGQEDWAKYCPLIKLHLKDIASGPVTRPDFIIADFFADAAVKDMMVEFGIPIESVWPQMPFLMAPVSYIPGQPRFSNRHEPHFGAYNHRIAYKE